MLRKHVHATCPEFVLNVKNSVIVHVIAKQNLEQMIHDTNTLNVIAKSHADIIELGACLWDVIALSFVRNIKHTATIQPTSVPYPRDVGNVSVQITNQFTARKLLVQDVVSMITIQRIAPQSHATNAIAFITQPIFVG
jgi:hypothetical protein